MQRQLLPIVNILGFVIMLFGATMLVPLGVSHVVGDAARSAYDESIFITLIAGLTLFVATRRFRRELMPRDGFLLVSLVWTTLPAFATLPLLFYFKQTGAPISFTDAYFEAMSGMTTTGATVLTGLEHLPPSINVWRHLLVWIGGMGIIVMAVAILPLLGVGGMQVYKAETPGPMKDAKLTPRITETAKGLYAVYLGISLACFLSYRAAGMNTLDAFCHMASTMGLGGFSTYDASFGQFNSPQIELVAIVFMTLAGFNFAMHFLAWRRRSLRAYVDCPEARWYLLVMYAGVAVVAVFLWVKGVYPEFLTALRHAAFNVVSIATTTGFASVDYEKWPAFAPILMLFLCAVKLGGSIVDSRVILATLAFMLIYGGTMILLTLIQLASGLDPITAFTSIVACLNNTGPGLGQVGPASNYQGLSDLQTWVCTAAMLLGRLELFSVIVLFTPAFWRR